MVHRGSTKKNGAPWLNHVMQIFSLFMLCGIFTSLLIPETQRKSLEELDREDLGDKPFYQVNFVSQFFKPFTPDSRSIWWWKRKWGLSRKAQGKGKKVFDPQPGWREYIELYYLSHVSHYTNLLTVPGIELFDDGDDVSFGVFPPFIRMIMHVQPGTAYLL
jgi:hypothetical protein